MLTSSAGAREVLSASCRAVIRPFKAFSLLGLLKNRVAGTGGRATIAGFSAHLWCVCAPKRSSMPLFGAFVPV